MKCWSGAWVPLCCMITLWRTTQGSGGGAGRSVVDTQELLLSGYPHHTFHDNTGASDGGDHHLGFVERYDLDLEYGEKDLHDLVEGREQYLLSDYQRDDFSPHGSQPMLYEEFLKKGSSHPGPAAVYLPRSREEREGRDDANHPTQENHNAESSRADDRLVPPKTPPALHDERKPATGGQSEPAVPAEEDVSEDMDDIISMREILNADDLEEAGRPLCRSRENYLPPDLYYADSCALCYGFLRNPDLFLTKWMTREVLKAITEDDALIGYKISVLVNPDNFTQVEEASVWSEAVLATFSGEEGRAKWRSCCQAAVHCCDHMLAATWPPGYCPNTWDGWQCWFASPPDTQAQRPCPSYIYHGKVPSCTKLASKRCEPDGRWFRPAGRQEWSNYTSCSVEQNIHRRLYVHIAAYSVSVAALLPALCIFLSYKQLRVHRITLHKHLFLSLLLEAVGVIIFRFLQLYKNDLIQQNPPWCITLNLLTKYTSLSNYMWYLCEGFYLHKLLASAFAEQNSLVVFYLIGWGFPLVPLTVYSVVRGLGEDNTHCWIVPNERLDWIINLPPLLAILINIIFVVNIIRILVSKVRATNANEPSQYRKAVRATMMVVPLFGLQYIVTIYRHQELGCDWHDLYQIFNNVIEGSTGAVVAIIFCYTNGEVKTLLKRSWVRLQERRAPRGGMRGAETLRSRSLSTVQTTLLDPSPARRNSSIVSICTNNQPFRRSNSGANASQLLSLRGSRTSITQTSAADGGSAPAAAAPSRRSPKQPGSKLAPGGLERLGSWKSPVHTMDSNSASRSPSLIEEAEDEFIKAEKTDKLPLPTGARPTGEKVERHHPVVLFRKDETEPCVNINVNGQFCSLRTSVDQGYESSHNAGAVDE